MSAHQYVSVFFLFLASLNLSAQTARIRGVILDKNNQPVENVNVSCLNVISQSNSNGFYNLKVPENQKVKVIFTHVSLKKISMSFTFNANEQKEFNPVMSDQEEQMGEIIV